MEKKIQLVIVSNLFSHHQKPVSDALFKLTDGQFAFVETRGLTEEQKALGYEAEISAPYLFRAYDGQAEHCRELIRSADAVVFGGAPESWIRERIRENKLILRCSERPLKHGFEPAKFFPRLVRWHYWNPPGKPMVLLCASAYAAGDYGRFGLFRKRCYRWGYFPPVKRYEDPDALTRGKDPARILWCGRFLHWKHPEDALWAAKRLNEEGIRFSLDFVGTGALEKELCELRDHLGLKDCVRFLGAMSPAAVREQMERAGIYLCCSDRQEGWGAVVNEAMNSACAVVCSDAVGAAPFLLRHRENGLIYPSGNVDVLTACLKELLAAPTRQRELGLAAYRTITEEWNADTAAQRLLALTKRLLSGESAQQLFASGPGSAAPQLHDNWFIKE